MNVTLVAMTARGVMAQYLDALVPELSKHARLHLVAPAHYTDGIGPGVEATGFLGPQSRFARGLMLANPFGADAVWGSIAASRPDVVHLFNGIDFPWSAVIARRARRAGVPVVVTLHDPRPHRGDPWWLLNTPGRSATRRSATAFHVHASVWRDMLVRRGRDHKRVHVIPIGNIGPRFLAYHTPSTPREPLALFFGRIERYKGVDDLVEATSLLPDGMRTAIAGPGRLTRRASRAVASMPQRFELYLGYQSDARIAHLLDRASVCVLPYVDATQSAIPLIAAAFGVPVVATRTGALVEDVPRVGGLLVPPCNPAALADGIRRAVGLQVICPDDLAFQRIAPKFARMYELVLAG